LAYVANAFQFAGSVRSKRARLLFLVNSRSEPGVDEIATSMFACVVFASVVPPGRSPRSVSVSLPRPSHNEW